MAVGIGEHPPLWYAVIAALPDPVAVLAPVHDGHGRLVDLEYVAVNPAGAGDEGSFDGILGRRVRDVWSQDLADQLVRWAAEILSTRRPLARDDVALPPGRAAERIDVRGSLVRGYVVFTWRDVTDRFRATQALAEAESRYRLLAENAADVVVRFDHERRLTYVSPAVRSLLGFEPEEMLGRTPVDLVHPDDLADMLSPLPVRRIEDLDDHPLLVRFRCKDGTYRWISRTARSLTDQEGRHGGGVATWRDAQQEVERLAELAEQARTDTLTGLLTRREGWRRLRDDMRDRRAGHEVAVLFCDLDEFREVNRRLGHTGGDTLLHTIADRLRGLVRDGDYVVRVGGDEMVVVLNGVTGPEAALHVAEKVRVGVAQPVEVGETSMCVTASIGVAIARPEETVASLVDRADQAMYAAKSAGKNQVFPIA